MADLETLCIRDVLRLQAVIEELKNTDQSSPLHNAEGSAGVLDRLLELSDLLKRIGMYHVWRDADHNLDVMLFLMGRKPGTSAVGISDAEQLQQALVLLDRGFQTNADYCRLVPASRDVPDADFGMRWDLDPPLPSAVALHLEEARRCWRVGHFLAALLFTFAATELVTGYYYRRVFTPKRASNATWGRVVGILKSHPHGAPDWLMEALSDVVSKYRNQVVHGQMAVDRDTAEMLYGVCARATREMIDSLISHNRVHVPPTAPEQAVILRAMDTLSGKASRHCVALVLCGVPTPEIQASKWDRLPDFGVLCTLTAAHVDHKLECCIREGLLDVTDDLVLSLAEGQAGKDRARRLAVDRMFDKVYGFCANREPEMVWPWIQHIPLSTKKAFLKALSTGEPQGELVPALKAWYVYEEPAVRHAINQALAALKEHPMPKGLRLPGDQLAPA